MQISSILFAMFVILAGSCVQSALGFGTTMITMGFLPLIMEYGKAMGLSIVMVSISTIYISVKYRESIQWGVMLPFLIPTAVICSIVNILSAKVSSDVMYLMLGLMFVAVSIFFFVFSNRIHIQPTPVSGTFLGVICGICYGLFASGGPTAALYLLPATKDKKEYCISTALFQKESLKRLKPAIYIAMLLAYAVLMPRIGFIIASLLLANGILAYFGTRKWWFYLIASANVFLAYFAFRAINVTLP